MAPSRGLRNGNWPQNLLVLLLSAGALLALVIGVVSENNKTTQKQNQNIHPVLSTTESFVDPDEVWDPTRPLPRSKALVYAYLKMHEVFPQIIPVAPRYAVEVVYANSVCVDFGNELKPDQVNVMPHRTVWPVEKGAYYTLILFTPDYPSRLYPLEGQYVYWFVANIFDTCITATGTTFFEYISPMVNETDFFNETGSHRFIFLVYKQPKDIMPYNMPHIPAEVLHEKRKHFNVTEFAKKHGLGYPIAANLFQSTIGSADKDLKYKTYKLDKASSKKP